MATSQRSDRLRRSSANAGSEITVRLEKFGPDQRALDTAAARVLRLATVRKQLGNARHRILSTVAVETEPASKPVRPAPASGRFRTTIYDYTNNRTLFVDGELNGARLIDVAESGIQPLPTRAEFDEAVAILTRD